MFKPGDGMIRLGDATSHGGKVITGQQNYVVHGKPVAVVGDKVTCPKDGHNGVCTIIEGHPTLRINGKQVAFHGCHTSCGAALVSSMSGTHMIGTEEAKSPPVPQPAFSPAAAAAGKVMSNETAEKESQSKIAPGFHVVREAGYRDQIKQDLLPSPSAEVDAMFERLNTHLPDYVLPGSLIVLSDPENQMCMAEEQTLQDQARLAQQTVQQLKPEQARALIVNWEAILELSDEVGSASTGMGVGAAAIKPLESEIVGALNELASAWEKTRSDAVRRSNEFFQQAEGRVKAWADRAFELGDKAQLLKAKLGVAISKRVHTVEQAMAGFPKFRLPTVAEGISKAGKFARTIAPLTYVGFGLDVASTQLKIDRACSDVSASKSCRQVQFEEYGGLAGRTAGGGYGADIGLAARARYCLGISVHPAGRLICSVVMVGGGAYAGVESGNRIGHKSGTVLYDFFYDDNAGPADE